MAVIVSCPSCKVKLKLKELPASGKFKCPKCGAVAAVAAPSATDKLVGRTIGGHKIQEVLARGAETTVYQGTQVSMRRPVAVKMLKPELANEQKTEEFLERARIAASFNHPSVVSIYDMGTENDVSYFSMEYVEGVTLDKLLKEKGPLPASRASGIILAVAQALSHAIQSGLVHFDLSPGTVMLEDTGGVKLLSSLVKLGDGPAPSAVNGLGRLFYELLTGKAPAPDGEYVPAGEVNNGVSAKIEHILEKMFLPFEEDGYTCLDEAIDALSKVGSTGGGPGMRARPRRSTGRSADRPGPRISRRTRPAREEPEEEDEVEEEEARPESRPRRRTSEGKTAGRPARKVKPPVQEEPDEEDIDEEEVEEQPARPARRKAVESKPSARPARKVKPAEEEPDEEEIDEEEDEEPRPSRRRASRVERKPSRSGRAGRSAASRRARRSKASEESEDEEFDEEDDRPRYQKTDRARQKKITMLIVCGLCAVIFIATGLWIWRIRVNEKREADAAAAAKICHEMYKDGYWEEAVDAYRQFLKDHPNSSEAGNVRALISGIEKELKENRKVLAENAALKNEPKKEE